MRRNSADARSARRGHRYATTFCDADERRLLFATPDQDAAHWTIEQIDVMHWLQRSGLKTARAWRLSSACVRCLPSARTSRYVERMGL